MLGRRFKRDTYEYRMYTIIFASFVDDVDNFVVYLYKIRESLKRKNGFLTYFDIVFFRGHELRFHFCGLDTRFDGCACFLTDDGVKVVVSQTSTNSESPETKIKPSA